MRKRVYWDINKIAIEFAKDGFRLISMKYINAISKLTCLCSNGHLCNISINDWISNNIRCPICNKRPKIDIKYVNSVSKGLRFKCLSSNYKNNHSKLEFICENKHVFYAPFSTILQGVGCPYCSGTNKRDIEEVKKHLKKFNYEYISGEYINCKSRLDIKCIKGHIFTTTYDRFIRGQRCPICSIKKGSTHYNWNNYSNEDLKKYKNYRNRVYHYTNINFRRYYYFINPKYLKRSFYNYHVDHIYSVLDGLKNNIPCEIIANPTNLQMLKCKDNISKKDKSSITIDELYKRYFQFIKEKGDQFEI